MLWMWVGAALAQVAHVSTAVVVAQVVDDSIVEDLVALVESHPESVDLVVEALLIDRRVEVCLARRFEYSSEQPGELYLGKRVSVPQGANWAEADVVSTRVHLQVVEPLASLKVQADVFVACTGRDMHVTLEGTEPMLLVGDGAMALLVSRPTADIVAGRGQLGQLGRIAEFADVSIGWNLRETKHAVGTLRALLD